MGCSLSKKKHSPLNCIRVVHFSGYVEDFYYPLTAGEVTGTPPKQFLCTKAHFISGYLKPLTSETLLELSHVYFMISYSTIQSESSPMDIASTAKRLIKLAKASGPQSHSLSSKGSSPHGTSLGSESPSKSPNPNRQGEIISIPEFGKGGLYKVPGSWKPLLDTIVESSFSRRSESDLREMYL